MPMNNTLHIGVLGEKLAVDYLKKQKYKVIERNFRKGFGEIDIIAIDEGTLVFIEVKTRTSQKFGTPLESINRWKLKTLVRTVQYYRMTHLNMPDSLRIDAIAVDLTSANTLKKIEHVKNISEF